MGQTLLVEENETLSMIYSLNLKMHVGTDVIFKKTHDEALELLKFHDGIDLIICRGESKDKDSKVRPALEIYRTLKNEDRHIPMIVVSNDMLLAKHCVVLPENVSIKDLLAAAAKCLGITPKMLEKIEIPEFYPIPIIYFANNEQGITCDAYLKMQSAEGPKFLKRFKAGDLVQIDDVERLIKKGVKNLFIAKDHRFEFVKQVTDQFLKRLYSENLTTDERVKATSSSIDIIRNQLQMAGLAHETVELAKAAIESVKKLVKASPVLKELMEKLLNNKTSFHYRHVQLITYVTFHALDNLEWSSEEHREKMSFIAFFHDITLTSDSMVKIHDEEDLKRSRLTDKEKLVVQTHALEAAKLVQNYPRTPFGAEQIIKQHHGSMSGTGLAKTFSNNISPLAIIFIVCEDFVHHYLKKAPDNSFDRDQVIIELYKKYPKSLYQKVVKTLENLDL